MPPFQINSTCTFRPTTAAARRSVSIVMVPMSGSSTGRPRSGRCASVRRAGARRAAPPSSPRRAAKAVASFAARLELLDYSSPHREIVDSAASPFRAFVWKPPPPAREGPAAASGLACAPAKFMLCSPDAGVVASRVLRGDGGGRRAVVAAGRGVAGGGRRVSRVPTWRKPPRGRRPEPRRRAARPDPPSTSSTSAGRFSPRPSPGSAPIPPRAPGSPTAATGGPAPSPSAWARP